MTEMPVWKAALTWIGLAWRSCTGSKGAGSGADSLVGDTSLAAQCQARGRAAVMFQRAAWPGLTEVPIWKATLNRMGGRSCTCTRRQLAGSLGQARGQAWGQALFSCWLLGAPLAAQLCRPPKACGCVACVWLVRARVGHSRPCLPARLWPTTRASPSETPVERFLCSCAYCPSLLTRPHSMKAATWQWLTVYPRLGFRVKGHPKP